MTTRITLSILLTTWLILIVGQTAAFLTARQSLLALMDDTLITRAARLLETAAGPPDAEAGASLPQGDQFQIHDEAGDLVTHSEDAARTTFRPSLIYRGFQVREDGTRVRAITLKTTFNRDDRRELRTIHYTRPTDRFERLLAQLAGMLLLISLACGLTTAWLALKLSRAALRPLRDTAEVIAQIDERNLSRRINAAAMPIELEAMTNRLNEMLERLESVFAQRKQFLADAAHELRTPTAALLTTLEVSLRRPREQAALMEALQSGLADARRLRKLVEQLMEHARGEQIRGPAAMQRTDVAELLRECLQTITPIARERGVTLAHELPEELPFVTQRDRVRSIALNLLSNAVEYNVPGGSVRLVASQSDQTLRIVIADTGRGIPPEQLPHVFEPFFRGGNGGRGDDPSHLGLGLFLVRSHVEALNGRCEVESRLSEGTTVTVTLPRVEAGSSNGVATAASCPSAASAG